MNFELITDYNRKLYSSDKKCSSNCLYCFANWSGYIKQDVLCPKTLDDKYDIIYPSCDGEFFINDISVLDEIISNTKRFTIISISTKTNLSEEIAKEIYRMNTELMQNKRGFIKLCITFTNESKIGEIEVGTSDFDGRVNTLRLLNKYDIPRAVMIKPILPFISIDEYKYIITKTSEYTNTFLLGDLYVDTATRFYKEYIKGKYKIQLKEIEWLDNMPKNKVYVVEESIQLKRQIVEYIRQKGLLEFESDIDLIKYMYRNLYS